MVALAQPLRAQQGDDLGLSVAVRAENGNQRTFRHYEPTTGEVRTYKARFYGGVGVTLAYERRFAARELSWSLSADYWRSLFFTSAARRPHQVVDTTAQRVSAVTALSIHPAGEPEGTSASVLAGVGAMRFDFDLPAPQSRDDETMELANGDYNYASAGIAGRLALANVPLALALRGSSLVGFDTGSFGARAVRGRPFGFDALAAIEYRMLPWLELALQAGMTGLVLQLEPLAERPEDATARVRDLYVSFGLAVKARF